MRKRYKIQGSGVFFHFGGISYLSSSIFTASPTIPDLPPPLMNPPLSVSGDGVLAWVGIFPFSFRDCRWEARSLCLSLKAFYPLLFSKPLWQRHHGWVGRAAGVESGSSPVKRRLALRGGSVRPRATAPAIFSNAAFEAPGSPMRNMSVGTLESQLEPSLHISILGALRVRICLLLLLIVIHGYNNYNNF